MSGQKNRDMKAGTELRIPRSIGKGRQVDAKALTEVQALLGDESRQKDLLIEHLHKIQDTYKHISAAHLVALAREMKLSKAEVYEVATFYHHFDVVKEGEAAPAPLTVRVCESLTCEMMGAQDLISSLEQGLGDDVRVQRVPCIGRCDKAPVAVVGMNPIENALTEQVIQAVDKKAIEPETIAPIEFETYIAQGGYNTYQLCMNGTLNIDKVPFIHS
jgi:NADH:ubiquinone oxidoreductase subunit E